MSYVKLEEPTDNPQLLEHFKQKGWLKKQSPSGFKAWQERYFMILNHGQQLAYFEDDKPKSKLKGALEIKEIESISQKENRFDIIFPGREFNLKAGNFAEATKWVQVLKALMVYCKEQGSQNKAEKGQEKEKGEKESKKQWKHIDSDSYQSIQLEREMSQGVDTSDRAKTITEDSNMILEKIGLREYTKNMNPDFINNRLCYGYLEKRSQGKVKFFQRRWFLIISAKPLYPQKYQDEQILDEGKIPPLFERDVLYYYSPEDDATYSSPSGDIKMIDCQEVIIKDMIKSKEKGYTFKINIGDRLYHLMADSEIERQKWVQAVKSSNVTAKEINNNLKIKVTKNIDPICGIYDSTKNLDGRREKLRAKINEDMERIKLNQLQGKEFMKEFALLLKYLDHVSQDLLVTMNCCLVKDPKRVDIVREYIDYLHEKICDMITSFWDKNYSKLASVNLLQLANWLYTYGQKMKEFCDDDRIQQGVRVLLNIYINRSIESVEQYVGEIIEYEKTNDPFENEKEQLVTQAPVDLFKIINEGYDLAYGMCPIKETAMKIAYFAKILIRQYQEGVELIMEEEGMNIERLIAFCNNTISLNTFSKQFYQRLTSQGGLTDEEADKIIDLNKIQKKFVSISNAARDMFFYHFFAKTGVSFKKGYLELNLDEIIKEVMSPAMDPIQKLHDSFSRKIWKQLLDMMVFYYFNSFIISCNKGKSSDLPKFKKKLMSDKETLQVEFDGFIFENLLKQGVQPFDDMYEFMEASSLGILAPCKNLRILFGKAFTVKTVKTLLIMRGDLSKDDKKETAEACGALIEDYNKQNVESQSEIEKLKLDSAFGVDEDEKGVDIEEELEKNQENRRQDITLDDDEPTQSSDIQMNDQSSSSAQAEKEEHMTEGTLFKKKPKEKDFFNSLMVNPMKQMVKLVEKNAINLIDLGDQLDWDMRFFRIRNGFIWLYQNDRSRESVGKFDLTKIEDIVAHPTKSQIFAIIMEGGKKHKFRAESKEIRDLWVKSIGKEIQNILNAAQEKVEAIKIGEGKKPIIKDYEEIERRERNKIKMEEKRAKMKERQEEIARKREEKRLHDQAIKNSTQMGSSSAYEIDGERPGAYMNIEGGSKQEVGCWTKFMMCLGLSKGP